MYTKLSIYLKSGGSVSKTYYDTPKGEVFEMMYGCMKDKKPIQLETDDSIRIIMFDDIGSFDIQEVHLNDNLDLINSIKW